MQYYDISIPASSFVKPIDSVGRYFYYTEGTTPLGVLANTALIVKCGNSGESFVLKPGQGVRLPDSVKSPGGWSLQNKTGAEVITGRVLIGDGEFQDSNTNNVFTLDATFANHVTVDNTTAARIPVTADITQTIPVSIAGNVNVSGAAMAYTNSYASTAVSVSNTAINLLAAGTNVNGAVLNKFNMSANPGANSLFAVIAKATAPANITDGDILYSGYLPSATNSRYVLDASKDGQVRVPAGKGIWYVSNVADGVLLRDALMTVL